MSLVTISELLTRAEAGGYAVGAFNCNNMEIVQAIISAAEVERSPVIIQASQGAIKYAGLGYITSLVREAALFSEVPVALHLDHGVCSLIHFCVHRGLSPLHAYKLFASIIWYYSTIIRALLIVDTKMSTRKTESPRPEVGSLRDMGTTTDRQTTLSSHLFR